MLNDELESFGVSGGFDPEGTMPGFNDRQRVMFKPLSGVLSQKKWIHLKYCPLEFEFELADQFDPIVSF